MIYHVPKKRQTLAEMGVNELSQIVIFDIEAAMDSVSNVSELFNIIGRQFEIPKHEYAA